MRSPLGPCAACFIPSPATTVMKFALGDSRYKISVCEQHADALNRDMLKWARMSEPDEIATFVPKVRTAPVENMTVPFPVVQTGEVITLDDELREIKMPLPRVRRATKKALMAADPELIERFKSWKLSEHARERAEERDVDLPDVLWAAELPDSSRQSDANPNLWVHQRGHIRVVVCPETREIVTVINVNIKDEGYKSYAAR
jgi:hypothetical protein